MVTVHVSSGVGLWVALVKARLVACPHVGDEIEIKGVTVHCDHVIISDTGKVYVRETRRFSTQAQAEDLQKTWGEPK